MVERVGVESEQILVKGIIDASNDRFESLDQNPGAVGGGHGRAQKIVKDIRTCAHEEAKVVKVGDAFARDGSRAVGQVGAQIGSLGKGCNTRVPRTEFGWRKLPLGGIDVDATLTRQETTGGKDREGDLCNKSEHHSRLKMMGLLAL